MPDFTYVSTGPRIVFPIVANPTGIRLYTQINIDNQTAALLTVLDLAGTYLAYIQPYTSRTIAVTRVQGFSINSNGAALLATDTIVVQATGGPAGELPPFLVNPVGPPGPAGPQGAPGATVWGAAASPDTTKLNNVGAGTTFQAYQIQQIINFLTGVMQGEHGTITIQGNLAAGNNNASNILGLGRVDPYPYVGPPVLYRSPIDPVGLYLAPDDVRNRLNNATGEYIQFRVDGRNFGGGSAADAFAAELRLSNITDVIGFNNAIEATVVFDTGGVYNVADVRLFVTSVPFTNLVPGADTGTITNLTLYSAPDPGLPPGNTIVITIAYGLHIGQISTGQTNYGIYIDGGLSVLGDTIRIRGPVGRGRIEMSGTGGVNTNIISFQTSLVERAAITHDDTDNVLYFGRSSASADVQIDLSNGNFFIRQRLKTNQGANVGTANNLALGNDGNYFRVTGSTQINLIDSTGWGAGPIVIKSNDGVTFKHNQANSGALHKMLLAGSVDFVCPVAGRITFIHDNVDLAWYEIARTLA